jgi:omega-amidase
MQDLRVTLVQSMLHWEDAVANRDMFARKLEGLAGHTDLVVLPEMFTTGFSMRSAELAEEMDGATVEWLRQQAKQLDAAVYGSAIITEGGRYHNRGLFVEPDGTITHYDKRHLFRMANEQEHFAPGTQRVVVTWRGWRILLQVCYDLRFPVFSRARRRQDGFDYDLVLYVANWPEPRRYPWSQLLIARAIENLAFVVGVNRVGMDGKGIHYSGDSVALGPRGEALVEAGSSQEAIATTQLDRSELLAFREKFPAHMDADGFELD